MEQKKTSANAKPTRKQTAYEHIKERILSCEYEPGVLMNEQTLCSELELSRTPVRDALSRLEQEGLVRIMPKKGFMVSSLKIGDVNRIYEVRLLLEPYALRKYGHNLDGAELKRLRLLMEDHVTGGTEITNHYDLDDTFHSMIMQAVGNKYLIDTYENIQNLDRRLRVMSGSQVENRLVDSYKEHVVILDACLNEDWETAAQAMTRHLEASRIAALHLLIGDEGKL